MARKSIRRKVRKSVRRQRALGNTPEVSHEATYAGKADEKLKAMREALGGEAPRCPVAFARMIDAVSYSGMAEAAATQAGGSGKPHTQKAVEAMNVFLKACRVE